MVCALLILAIVSFVMVFVTSIMLMEKLSD